MLHKDQTRKLKARAHSLNPLVMIGQNEVTAAVLKEIDTALKAHELIKIRINAADKAHRQQMAHAICEQSLAELIDIIGHVAIVYRKNEAL